MGILPHGPNGGFIGKAGGYIGYYQYGKWIIRGRPKLSRKNKKGSVDQKACRSRFSKMQYFLGPITPFIRVGFNLESKRNNNSAHNSAKSWNMLNAFHENGEIDYSAFRFSAGSLPGAADAAVEVDGSQLIFTWRDNSDEGFSQGKDDRREDDQVMILIYNIAANDVWGTKSGARRSECREVMKVRTLEAPIKYHTWISFIADNRLSIANSIYTGEWEV
jgi:hypothetical protein